MVRYKVEIDTFGMATGPTDPSRVVRDLSLAAAWRVVQRAARRGRNRFGGEVVRGDWGARGGTFPARYRSAVIKVDRIGGRAEPMPHTPPAGDWLLTVSPTETAAINGAMCRAFDALSARYHFSASWLVCDWAQVMASARRSSLPMVKADRLRSAAEFRAEIARLKSFTPA